jgi:hypothetical protein
MKGPAGLIDWGVKDIRQEKNVTCLEKLDALITFYGPEFVVFENPSENPVPPVLTDSPPPPIGGASRRQERRSGKPRRAKKHAGLFLPAGCRDEAPQSPNPHQSIPRPCILPPAATEDLDERDPRMSIFESLALALAFWYADNPPSSIEGPVSRSSAL